MNTQVKQILQNYGDDTTAMPADVAAIYNEHQCGLGQTLRHRHALKAYNEVHREHNAVIEAWGKPEFIEPEVSAWQQIGDELTDARWSEWAMLAVTVGLAVGFSVARIKGWI